MTKMAKGHQPLPQRVLSSKTNYILFQLPSTAPELNTAKYHFTSILLCFSRISKTNEQKPHRQSLQCLSCFPLDASFISNAVMNSLLLLHFSSHWRLLSGSSKKTHHCSAVRASLSHKSNTFLRPLTLLNGVGE